MDYITQQIQKAKNNNRHPFTERNNKIREQYASGKYTYGSLAKMYRLSRSRISVIVNNSQEVKA